MPSPRPISATALVPRAAASIFDFLCDLENHWLLGDRFVALESVGDRGGRIRIRGPLGVARHARATIVTALPPAAGESGLLEGRAELDSGSVGRIAWRVEPQDERGARVTLEAVVERAVGIDRLLLAAGGRYWLRRSFTRTLAGLARLVR